MGTLIAELDDPNHLPPLRLKLRFADVRLFVWARVDEATTAPPLELFNISHWGWESPYLVAGLGRRFVCRGIEVLSISPILHP